ncbi:MAG: peptidoglycan-associated lipoprotein Pal [Candidatus Aminicenantes bacterium]|nr:peptidoglycan-associated lipoprotein Pal [Candidatus Aminicenantes bacterium]
MRKGAAISLAFILAIAFTVSCRKKVAQVPPPPAVVEQPAVAAVDEGAKVVRPVLSEEEIYAGKTLDEINREAPLAMIHFDYDKYDIREDAKPVLRANSAWLQKFRTAKVLVEGHCDDRGTEDYNLALGEKRAKSTQDYLVSLGVDPGRIRIISYGKSQPLDPAANEFSWARNRRAQFLLIEK